MSLSLFNLCTDDIILTWQSKLSNNCMVVNSTIDSTILECAVAWFAEYQDILSNSESGLQMTVHSLSQIFRITDRYIEEQGDGFSRT